MHVRVCSFEILNSAVSGARTYGGAKGTSLRAHAEVAACWPERWETQVKSNPALMRARDERNRYESVDTYARTSRCTPFSSAQSASTRTVRVAGCWDKKGDAMGRLGRLVRKDEVACSHRYAVRAAGEVALRTRSARDPAGDRVRVQLVHKGLVGAPHILGVADISAQDTGGRCVPAEVRKYGSHTGGGDSEAFSTHTRKVLSPAERAGTTDLGLVASQLAGRVMVEVRNAHWPPA